MLGYEKERSENSFMIKVLFFIVATSPNGIGAITPAFYAEGYESRKICERAIKDLEYYSSTLNSHECIAFDGLNRGSLGK